MKNGAGKANETKDTKKDPSLNFYKIKKGYMTNLASCR